MKSDYLTILATWLFVASTAYADKLDSDGILRSDDGSVRFMHQYDAIRACPQGTRLPTIRELARLSQASGAKGILELSQVNPNRIPVGYHKVSAINPNGQKDKFYFNYEGYKRPSGALGNNWFWSSSLYSDFSDGGFVLHGSYGYVSDYYRLYYFGAVRCVVGQ